MSFTELDPDDIRKLLEGHADILTPMLNTEAVFFRHVTCPMCGSSDHVAKVDAARPFSPGSALPNKVLTCSTCQAEFDPYTKFIRRVPTPESG